MSHAENKDVELLLIGVNHTTAPVEVRERLAIPAERLAEATRSLVHQPGIHEAMILSTCNRVEFLMHRDVAADADEMQRTNLPRFLHEYFALPAATIAPHLYQYREREAVRHLFRVTSSLDSMVVGEPQILGQVKASWNVAREIGAVQAQLDPLLQRAFSVAKRVRSETKIGSSSVSIASVAADLARNIFGSLNGKTVLLVGAGKIGDLAARHLIQHGVATLLVCNRTETRAERVADALRQPAITTGVIPFEHLQSQAHRADIIITSTGAGKLFSVSDAQRSVARRLNRPVFFIDIAVPRDVDPEVNKIEGCFVYDMDDLQQLASQNHALRSREAMAAELIVAREVDLYQQRRDTRPVVEAIRELQQVTDAVRLKELARTAQRLAATPLTEAQAAAVEEMSKSLMAKLLHAQIAALRESGKREKS